MHRALRAIDWLATRNRIIGLVILFTLVFGAILLTLQHLMTVTGGFGILDFDVGYTPARVMAVFESYGPEGMALYARIQALDLINPALYALIAAVLTRRLWAGKAPDWIGFAPFLAALGDYAENATLFLMARAYPDIPDQLVDISSTLSLTKNAAMLVGFAPLVLGVLIRGFQGLRGTAD